MKNIGVFLALLLFPVMVFAATATPAGQSPLGCAPTPEPVQYDLPYPGMLPNNPLYVLKQARDWILDKLIMDPVKKTEFYILQGDKRLAMGLMLSASGNGVLSEQTISKGEKYMNNAVQSLLTLKAQGKDVPAYITDHLTQSLAKHAEVLTAQIQNATDATIKSGLTGSLDLVTTLRADLPKLK
ncbi:MAG: hypothetical protein NT149_03635 [Candidatus Gottesmanbacteria bacterium]|nr:hypothetical protein [Candidatus Gottesmanbacteria bacterium]